jgi:hypothetical protein
MMPRARLIRATCDARPPLAVMAETAIPPTARSATNSGADGAHSRVHIATGAM